MKTSLLVLTFLIQICISCFANTKEQAPLGLKPQDFRLPPIRSLTLANGLKVSFIQWGRTPLAKVALVSNTGQAFWQQNPAVPLVAYYLMANHSLSKIDKQKLANYGGQLSFQVGIEQSAITIEVVTEYSAETVRLLAKSMLSSQFSQAHLTEAKDALAKQLLSKNAINAERLQKIAFQNVFLNHPLQLAMLTKESIRNVNLAQVQNFISQAIEPNSSHLYVAGVLEQDEIAGSIQSAFGRWKFGQSTKLPELNLAKKPNISIYKDDTMNNVIVSVALAAPPLSSEGAITLSILKQWVDQHLRQQLSDVALVDDFHSQLYFTTMQTVWVMSVKTHPEQGAGALSRIVKGLAFIRETTPSPSTLTRAHANASSAFLFKLQDREDVIRAISLMHLHQLPVKFLAQYVYRMSQVKGKSVKALSQLILADQKLHVIVIGNTQVVIPALKQLPELKQYW
ncbi:M16 family metallopeptidase [Thalassotalea agarivorans]|uniref:Predicted Zn-dependent peptidase n=1 Tax=Thalassotalea agarivorans TaxID=349064 RepID=A0A1I0AVJ4_THASX|nr:insulinase family protein [Thalassotalea agarivorans]SES97797.1 Predicted Zn-dependent peptidase [Thalassotalea agarivorans]